MLPSKTKKSKFNKEEEEIEHEIPKMTIEDIHQDKVNALEKALDRDMHRDQIKKKVKFVKSSNKINLVSEQIESSIFEYTLIYSTIEKYKPEMYEAIYRDKFDDIMSELDKKIVKDNIKSGVLHPKYLCFYSPQQIDPLSWKSITDKQKRIEQKKEVQIYSDLYECSKCNQKKTVVRQAQTRSADEPMTIFVTCINCKNMWTC